ncbi:hypothetical protein [Solimonas flava]|uniref:hypothetical protein n=1 Tax=Solimonas flava TaxID=415849 RepID=UPI0005BAD5D1|nr:hypothetical protein [Solimonas flava]
MAVAQLGWGIGRHRTACARRDVDAGVRAPDHSRMSCAATRSVSSAARRGAAAARASLKKLLSPT